MSLPRWMHWLYAKARGYFWLPCPRCGKMYGGHERGGRQYSWDDGIRRMTCTDCLGEYQIVTCGPTQTITLPPAFTGESFTIINRSTGPVTVQREKEETI